MYGKHTMNEAGSTLLPVTRKKWAFKDYKCSGIFPANLGGMQEEAGGC
jgi:hypothetical protein